MQTLTVLQDPILPVFAIMALGFVMGRAGFVTDTDARLINRVVMTIFLPLMVFGVIAHAPIRDFALIPVLIYAGAQALIFSLGFLLSRKLFRIGPRESVLIAFGAVFANNALYILPLSVLLYGTENVLPVTTIVTWDATVTFGAAMIAMQLMEAGRVSPGAILRSFARTPMLIAIVIGVAVSLAGLTLPAPVETFTQFNGAAAAPMALFALGVILSATSFRPDGAVVSFTLIKLFVFPAAVALGLYTFATPEPANDLFLLASAGPAGAMSLSLALLHGVRTDTIAQVMVYTNVLTLGTLALLA